MSSDGVSAVTVTRDEGNADAPGSSGDRNAEADGREIPRLRLYADLTYFPGYIDSLTSPSTPEINIHSLGITAAIRSASPSSRDKGDPYYCFRSLDSMKLRSKSAAESHSGKFNDPSKAHEYP